jgi:hypothetical protein
MAAYGGPYDLTLDFGYRVEPSDDPSVQARVTMSWEHASAMVKAIQTMVDGYQEMAGNLPNVEQLRESEGQ